MKFLACSFCLFALVASSRPARAAASAERFALVVTNNRSSSMDKPDLQYADDDGVRYFSLFRAAFGDDHVALLTTLDRATADAHPEAEALARPANQRELRRAISGQALRIEAAKREGRATEFYFVYAGHGDIDHGRGFLDLEDGPIDGEFLEREVIGRLAATRLHFILDSCNSFFVFSPRKPGGRRWGTPEDLALGFAERHPNVGLLLSTNSEAEVYEWSELESGIFSHEVRSALSGAADVDRNGEVSYAEVAAFIETANAGVPERYRPHLFFRGPGGDASAPLLGYRAARGRSVVLGPDEQRIWIKNAAGERLVDLHKEKGPMSLVVPGPVDQPLELFARDAPGSNTGRPTVHEYEADAGSLPIELATLAETGASPAPRGGSRTFANLFARPFGPAAFQDYERRRMSAAPPVYGINHDDEERIRNYLEALAAGDRQQRLVLSYVASSIGAITAATGAALYFQSEPDRDRKGGAILAGFGLGMIGFGTYEFLTRYEGETALSTFNERLGVPGADWEAIVADTEQRLENMARREHRNRLIGAWTLGLSGAAVAGLTTSLALHPPPGEKIAPSGYAALYGLSACYIAGGFLLGYVKTPTENLLDLYRRDPDLKIGISAGPVAGGLAIGINGRF